MKDRKRGRRGFWLRELHLRQNVDGCGLAQALGYVEELVRAPGSR